MVLTGRLSTGGAPLAGRPRRRGTVLLPGTAFVELAVRAGDEVGCGRVEELTLHAPLVLTERGGWPCRSSWARRTRRAADRSPCTRGQDAVDLPWDRHATGVLAAATRPGAPT